MIYVINLDKDRDRMDNISSQLYKYNLEFERFNAIKGVDVYDKYNTSLKPSQLGCFLSHIGVISLIKNGIDDYGIILEDDSILTEWMNNIHDFIEKYIPKIFDIVWIGNSRCKWPRNTCNIIPDYDYNLISKNRVNDFIYKITPKMMKTHNYPIGTYGIIISKQGAEKILSSNEIVKMDKPIDELLIRLNLNKYMTIPSIIIHCYDFDSNIDTHSYKRINPWNNIWREYPESERDILYLLEKLGEILDNNNVKYSISGETLLGYARNGMLTSYNDNIEITLKKENIENIENIFNNLPTNIFNIYKDNFSRNSIYKIFPKNSTINVKGKKYNWPYINVKIDDFNGKNIDIIIGNITSYTGEKYSVKIFKNYTQILDKIYKNWKNICTSPNYSNIDSTKLNSYTFNCTNIIPGYNRDILSNEDISQKYGLKYNLKYNLNKNIVFFLLFSLGIFYIYILGIKKGILRCKIMG